MTKKILVVDDSAMVRSMFRQAIDGVRDCRVHTANNGKEALDAIRADGEPDLIFLDVNMPVMDGLEFLARCSESGLLRRIPVVIVSTEGKDADIRRGLAAGARAYVRKPFQPQAIRAVVERLFAVPPVGAPPAVTPPSGSRPVG